VVETNLPDVLVRNTVKPIAIVRVKRRASVYEESLLATQVN